jgi:hypothetical protein
MNERERQIILAALSYMASNIDDVNDVNEVIEDEKQFNETEVFELFEKLIFKEKEKE